MCAVYSKQDGENKELDLLVKKVADISCGNAKIIME